MHRNKNGSVGSEADPSAEESQSNTPWKQPVLKWKADGLKNCLLLNFEKRGWIRTEDDAYDWNFYWMSVGNIRFLFNPDNRYRLRDDQLVNHYPNHVELTRKDLMVKNIRRYLKDLSRGSYVQPPEEEGFDLNFVPATFNLPADYSLFLEEFKKQPASSMWIMKPSSKAQGKGIFLINKLSQIKRWASSKWGGLQYIISTYIDRPLLVGGKKFDLRIYVLVTNYRPLKVYVHEEGFGRFCNVKYNNKAVDMDNMYVHLTNVAIQKTGEGYNKTHGGKWRLKMLKLWVQGIYGQAAAAKLFRDMYLVILHSLKSVQPVMINDKHCFECYGYDLLIDNDLKPWLVEVNASPSLSASTVADGWMKEQVINDVLDVLVTPEWPNSQCANTCTETVVGGFKLLYDQAAEQSKGKKENDSGGGGGSSKRGGHKWR